MENKEHRATRLELMRKMKLTLAKVTEFREVSKEEIKKELNKTEMKWEKSS